MNKLTDQKLEELYQLHADSLFQYLLAKTGNKTESEDLVGDTFLKASLEPRLADPEFNSRAWLFKVATNLSHNLWNRLLNRFVQGLDHLLETPTAISLEAEVEKRDNFIQLSRELQKLKERDREIIWLRYFEEMSYQEIAQITNLPAGTIASKIARAVRSLKNAVQ
jgi:RNA polymerase sigma-70 factor (ECF subfamily)